MSTVPDWSESGDRRTMETFVRVGAIAADMIEIKSSLKEMAIALGKLAIVEERQMQDRSSMDRIFKELVTHEARLKILELAQPLQKQTTDWFSRIVWVIFSTVLAAILSFAVMDRSANKVARIGQIATETRIA